MPSPSGRGRWERFIAARSQARAELGQTTNERDPYDRPTLKRIARQAGQPTAKMPFTEGIAVLSLGEAANLLGLSRGELEAMIAAGWIKALPTRIARHERHVAKPG